VITRGGFIETDNLNRSVTVYGVDYSSYEKLYSTTFIAADGTIPKPLKPHAVVGNYV
jgi:hypothetical protein